MHPILACIYPGMNHTTVICSLISEDLVWLTWQVFEPSLWSFSVNHRHISQASAIGLKLHATVFITPSNPIRILLTIPKHSGVMTIESRLQLVLDSSRYLSKVDNITAIEIISRQFLYTLHLHRTTTIAVLDPKPHTPPIPCPDPEPPPAADSACSTQWLPTQRRWGASQMDGSSAAR